MFRRARVALFVIAATLAALPAAGVASAQAPSSTGAAPAAAPAGQGVAVLAIGQARDDAYALARAVYGSRLRPPALDEVRARVLAGGPPPPNASRELVELAEVRAGVTGEDAAGRRLLTGLARQVGAEALLVVRLAPAAPAAPPPPPRTPSQEDWPSFEPPREDGGAGPGPGPTAAAGNAGAPPTVVARLFLADSGDFDAARYSPEPGLTGPAAWRSTVVSLEARFPAASRTVAPTAATRGTPGSMKPEEGKSTPFYASGWFWGSLGAAALLGAAFYFASRDTSDDAIHLQMRVPK